MRRLAIVVHIYKSELSDDECISLTQLTRTLSSHPVFLVSPPNIDLHAYQQILKTQLEGVIHFEKYYFNNLKGYNALLMNKKYYEPFLNFEYVLLHHADAFLFESDIDSWLDKQFDYLGAPVYAYDGTAHPSLYLFSGNGGLSLRKVRTFYELAASFHSVFNWDEIKEDFLNYNWKGKLSRMPYYFMLITTLGSRLHPLFNRIHINEDAIWGMLVPKYIKTFKNAPFDEALKFSMEFNCDTLYELNGAKLPFGCHGWNKAQFKDFWRPYIEQFGYQVK